MRFEWDQRKASANLRKHGVAFADAMLCLPIRLRGFSRTRTTRNQKSAS